MRDYTWSLRRLRIPVNSTALVLEVGSGGNPYPRANILVDAYEETRERHWEPLVADRPTALAFGENLPFRDKAFDFVIAAHVLEHTPDPARFLGELERVAKAGYIETPDAFMERVNPYHDHRLEVTVRNGQLVIRKKPRWAVDAELIELYEPRVKRVLTSQLIPAEPRAFHVRYYWQDKINYRILNPEVDAGWSATPTVRPPSERGLFSAVRRRVLNGLRWLYSQNARNARLDLVPLLLCQGCRSSDFERRQPHAVVCRRCGAEYEMRGRICYCHRASGRATPSSHL